MEDNVARLEPPAARIEAVDSKLAGLDAKFESKIDRLDARFESKFESLRFTLLIALLSATVTLVATVLGVLLSGQHAH